MLKQGDSARRSNELEPAPFQKLGRLKGTTAEEGKIRPTRGRWVRVNKAVASGEDGERGSIQRLLRCCGAVWRCGFTTVVKFWGRWLSLGALYPPSALS